MREMTAEPTDQQGAWDAADAARWRARIHGLTGAARQRADQEDAARAALRGARALRRKTALALEQMTGLDGPEPDDARAFRRAVHAAAAALLAAEEAESSARQALRDAGRQRREARDRLRAAIDDDRRGQRDLESWAARQAAAQRPSGGEELGPPAAPDAEPGRCRVCGCTAVDCSGCVERTGEPCEWADATQALCTACVGKTPEQVRAELADLPPDDRGEPAWRHEAIADHFAGKEARACLLRPLASAKLATFGELADRAQAVGGVGRVAVRGQVEALGIDGLADWWHSTPEGDRGEPPPWESAAETAARLERERAGQEAALTAAQRAVIADTEAAAGEHGPEHAPQPDAQPVGPLCGSCGWPDVGALGPPPPPRRRKGKPKGKKAKAPAEEAPEPKESRPKARKRKGAKTS